MQHLPALISLAAKDMTAKSVLGGSSSSCSSSSSSSSSSSTGGRGGTTTRGATGSRTANTQMARLKMLKSTVDVLDHSDHVVSLSYCIIDVMRTAGVSTACLQPAPAALQLMLTGYETLPRVLQQLGPEEWRDIPMAGYFTSSVRNLQREWVLAAHNLIWSISKTTTALLSAQPSQSAGQGVAARDSTLEKLLTSPQLHRCLILSTCVAVLALNKPSSSSSCPQQQPHCMGSGCIAGPSTAHTIRQQLSAAHHGWCTAYSTRPGQHWPCTCVCSCPQPL
jgi:hypothetical protein